MKTNLWLFIPSVVQITILIWHMMKYRGKKFALAFIGFGLIFGLVRSYLINTIQLGINDSLRPYEFGGAVLKIFGDPLQVYIGWITTAYLALCLAEIFYRKYQKEKAGIFQIIAIAFLFITTFSYMVEASASVMNWWRWNSFLETGFATSIFRNVPWVGIIDWGTVAFEYLGIFLLVGYGLKKKKTLYLFAGIVFPVVHWLSHTNPFFVKLGTEAFSVTLPTLIHLIIPVLALALLFVDKPESSLSEKNTDSDKLVYAAFLISFAVCLLVDIIRGDLLLLVSLLPISLFVLSTKISLKRINLAALTLMVIATLLPIDRMDKMKIVFGFYPLIAVNFFEFINRSKFRLKLKHIGISVAIIGFVLLLLIWVPSIEFSKAEKVEPTKSQKKVILVTLDTVRQDHYSTYGYSRETDPSLKALAKEGTLYKNAYAAIPYTLPSHMSILSGIAPNNFGLITDDFPNYQDTLPELFGSDEYQTAAFISAFQLYRSTVRKGFVTFDYDDRPEVTRRSGQDTNKEVFKWLGENKDKDFFMMVHYYDAHSPYNPCETDYFTKGLKTDKKNIDPKTVRNNLSDLSKDDLSYLIASYDEGIRCADNSLGELIGELKKQKIYEDATIIVIGDHGENFDHGALFHGANVYESAVKVPLVVKSPFIKKGEVGNNVSEMDIYKTLTSIFNLKFEKERKGTQDLRKTSNNRYLYFQANKNTGEVGTTTSEESMKADSFKSYTSIGLRYKNKKYISTDGKIEIYDLKKDSEELSNLYGSFNPEVKSILLKLRNYFQ